jgi:hypothetical protein
MADDTNGAQRKQQQAQISCWVPNKTTESVLTTKPVDGEGLINPFNSRTTSRKGLSDGDRVARIVARSGAICHHWFYITLKALGDFLKGGRLWMAEPNTRNSAM